MRTPETRDELGEAESDGLRLFAREDDGASRESVLGALAAFPVIRDGGD